MKKLLSILPISVIITTYNEIDSINELLIALQAQTQLPKEVVIVDANSTDGTWEFLQNSSKKKWPFQLIIESCAGNRSIGRNRAFNYTSQSWLAITDAGCYPLSTWLEELWKQCMNDPAWVVAGYYYGMTSSRLEEAIVPYVLVMPDRVNVDNFLPATRSMMMHRAVWLVTTGFDEFLNDNEDYAFAKRLKCLNDVDLQEIALTKKLAFVPSTGAKIITFAQKAQVGWKPRSNLYDFFWMIFRFARGDAFADLWRPKVCLIFLRYMLLFLFFVFSLWIGNFFLQILLFILIISYLTWSIAKNLRYASKAWYYLPVLQIVSDFAVIFGSISGLFNRLHLLLRDRWVE